ncbi:unnamed protein product [Boreogadus saida]
MVASIESPASVSQDGLAKSSDRLRLGARYCLPGGAVEKRNPFLVSWGLPIAVCDSLWSSCEGCRWNSETSNRICRDTKLTQILRR